VCCIQVSLCCSDLHRPAVHLGYLVLVASIQCDRKATEHDGVLVGIGLYGKLGHLNEETEPIPRPVNATNVVSVSVGLSHTAFITESGQLFAFGEGAFGKLGIDNTLNQPGPR